MGNAMSGLRNDGEMRLVCAPTRRARPGRLVMALGAGPIMLGVLAVAIPTELAAAAPASSAASSAASPAAAKPSGLKYTVVNGDYLWGIAIKLGVKFVDLLTVNSFTMDTVIIPGQTVVVPEGGTLPAVTTPAATTPATAAAAASGPYVVVSGDSLSTIAQRMGVTLPALLKANTLKIDSVIHPGTQLSIPAGGHMPAPKSTTLGAIDGAASTGQPVNADRVNDAATVPPNAAATPAADSPAAGTAAAGQAPAQAALPAGYTSYTIAAGDYLVGIAAKNGVTLKALLAANDLITTSAIQPGQQLSVPPATLPIPPATPDAAATDAASPGAGQSAGQQSIAALIAFLEAQVGKPYAFNTEGPETFDCSGLVTAAYRQIGVSLPHQSLLQSTKGTAVDWNSQPLLPGDLIFMFSTANPTVISHVGIVIDSQRWIQAGGSPTAVKIGPLPNAAKIQAVRRIVQP